MKATTMRLCPQTRAQIEELKSRGYGATNTIIVALAVDRLHRQAMEQVETPPGDAADE